MRAEFLAGMMLLAPVTSSARAQKVETLMGVTEGHCSVAQGTHDGRTFACQVWNHDPERFARPTQIEIYRDHRLTATIEPGAPIAEWHFWNHGEQISVHSGGTYRLYETATAKQIAHTAGVRRYLPTWAKDRAELEDESVPEGPAYVQQRTLWITKVLREIEAIRPGMTRRELESIMTTEGGISTGQRRTYVYRSCPYIKVDAVFAPTGANEEGGPDHQPVTALPAVFRDELAVVGTSNLRWPALSV